MPQARSITVAVGQRPTPCHHICCLPRRRHSAAPTFSAPLRPPLATRCGGGPRRKGGRHDVLQRKNSPHTVGMSGGAVLRKTDRNPLPPYSSRNLGSRVMRHDLDPGKKIQLCRKKSASVPAENFRKPGLMTSGKTRTLPEKSASFPATQKPGLMTSGKNPAEKVLRFPQKISQKPGLRLGENQTLPEKVLRFPQKKI